MGNKIIRVVKQNLTVVICGSLAVLSITAIVLGILLPEAQAGLSADKSVYDGLQAVSGRASNDRVVEDVRRSQNRIRREVQEFLTSAAKGSPRTLLHPDVFPAVKEQFHSFEFKQACDRKRRELLRLLNAQDEPSQQDIGDYLEQMRKAQQRAEMEEGRTTVTPAPFGRTQPLMGRSPGGAGAFGGMGAAGTGFAGQSGIPEGMSPEEWVKQDAWAGASIKRAQQVYCYAKTDSLDPRSFISDKHPIPEIMWEAQLSLWIQEDIISVLAKLNNEAAAQLPEEQRWVSHLPIKELMYIAVGDYLPKAAGDQFVGTRTTTISDASPSARISDPKPPAPNPGFTARTVDDKLDVVNLAVGLVIDANHLLRLLDEISKIGFYTPLLISYEAVPYDPNLRGRIYGPAPVVRVRIELEHCILREKLTIGDKLYVDLMPETIKTGTWMGSDRSRGGAGETPFFNPAGGGRGGRREEF